MDRCAAPTTHMGAAVEILDAAVAATAGLHRVRADPPELQLELAHVRGEEEADCRGIAKTDQG